jgi:hypothetical protein
MVAPLRTPDFWRMPPGRCCAHRLLARVSTASSQHPRMGRIHADGPVEARRALATIGSDGMSMAKPELACER